MVEWAYKILKKSTFSYIWFYGGISWVNRFCTSYRTVNHSLVAIYVIRNTNVGCITKRWQSSCTTCVWIRPMMAKIFKAKRVYRMSNFTIGCSKLTVSPISLTHLTLANQPSKSTDRPHRRDNSKHIQPPRTDNDSFVLIGQTVRPWERWPTDGRTDRRTDATKYIISPASRSIKSSQRENNHDNG